MTKIKNNGLCKEKAKMSIKEEMKQAKWRMLRQYLRLNVNSTSKKAMNFYLQNQELDTNSLERIILPVTIGNNIEKCMYLNSTVSTLQ